MINTGEIINIPAEKLENLVTGKSSEKSVWNLVVEIPLENVTDLGDDVIKVYIGNPRAWLQLPWDAHNRIGGHVGNSLGNHTNWVTKNPQINDNKFGHSTQMGLRQRELGLVGVPFVLTEGIAYEIKTFFYPGHVQGEDSEGYPVRETPYYGFFDGQHPVNWSYDTLGDILANVSGQLAGIACIMGYKGEIENLTKYTIIIPGPDYTNSDWTELATLGYGTPK